MAVQWLGLSAFTARAQVQSLVGELRSHKLHGVTKKKDVFECYNTQNCTCNRIRREISEIQIYLSMYKQSVYDKCGIPNHWIIQVEKSI